MSVFAQIFISHLFLLCVLALVISLIQGIVHKLCACDFQGCLTAFPQTTGVDFQLPAVHCRLISQQCLRFDQPGTFQVSITNVAFKILPQSHFNNVGFFNVLSLHGLSWYYHSFPVSTSGLITLTFTRNLFHIFFSPDLCQINVSALLA